jgi:hypothetical protein
MTRPHRTPPASPIRLGMYSSTCVCRVNSCAAAIAPAASCVLRRLLAAALQTRVV